jgi:hypothetical protein
MHRRSERNFSIKSEKKVILHKLRSCFAPLADFFGPQVRLYFRLGHYQNARLLAPSLLTGMQEISFSKEINQRTIAYRKLNQRL